jgi:hypothetical protein
VQDDMYSNLVYFLDNQRHLQCVFVFRIVGRRTFIVLSCVLFKIRAWGNRSLRYSPYDLRFLDGTTSIELIVGFVQSE